MSDLERPTTPLPVKAGALVLIALLAWLIFGTALSVVKLAIAFIGYIAVGTIAFMVGRAVGRKQR